jgi:hypothetical protein
MRGQIGRWSLRAVTGIAWAGDLLSTFLRPGQSADHGLLDIVVLALTFWVLLDSYAPGRRAAPGKLTVDEEDFTSLLDVMGAGALARVGEENDGGGGCARRPA